MNVQNQRKPKAKKIKKPFLQHIATVAGNIVSKKGYVSVIDLFLEIGWFMPNKLADWKSGKIPYLERIITANFGKISRAMKAFKSWAVHSKLKPSFTVYKHKGNILRFSKTDQANIETAYCTHYVLQKFEIDEMKKTSSNESTFPPSSLNKIEGT